MRLTPRLCGASWGLGGVVLLPVIACTAPTSKAVDPGPERVAATTAEVATEGAAKLPAAEKPLSESPIRGFWAPFAEKGHKFVLHDELAEPHEPRRLEIEVVAVEDVNGFMVSRLRWTKVSGSERMVGDSVFDAVILQGESARVLWEVSEPSREDIVSLVSEPLTHRGIPKKGDEGVVEPIPDWDKPGVACIREDQSVEGEDCRDTCEGHACFGPEGIVHLDGLLAPEWGFWSATLPKEEG